ncbi:MAG: DUF1116 domain-containing protein [Caldisericaceae bacterium]|jgi:hypothetical protein|nr:DUF1116 domain-containing protein [Caldisericaceae bacterium]
MVDIEKANKEALDRLLSARPMLVGMGKAVDVIPGMKKNMILHAGPPVTWDRMCGPQKGAVIGALMYEGMAKNEKEAEELAASGEIEFSPCHHHQTVGPMAGIVSPSMPVYIIENEAFGNKAYGTMNEGLGKVLRMGAYSPDVIERLKWMEEVMYPAMDKAIRYLKKIDLKNIIAQALHMGDELHNRNKGATSLFFRTIAPAMVKTSDAATAEAVLKFIDGNDHTFLNLSMPAAKASLDPARNIEGSTMVVAMARNGTDFGIQVSGMGDEWFTAPAPVPPNALYFPGFTKEDANPDIGDSSITETAGLGGFAIGAAPAIVQFVGGTPQDGLNRTLSMYEITIGENNVYQVPYLNFRGTPTGIDIRKVVEKNLPPFIDTGIAHKKPGIGQVGAGLVDAPMDVFKKAVIAFAKKYS